MGLRHGKALPICQPGVESERLRRYFYIRLSFTDRTMEQELVNGWLASVHPDDLDSCVASIGPSFDARLPLKMEYRLHRADGEYRRVLSNGVPRFEEGWQIRRLCWLLH
jgi:hypothetical protein